MRQLVYFLVLVLLSANLLASDHGFWANAWLTENKISSPTYTVVESPDPFNPEPSYSDPYQGLPRHLAGDEFLRTAYLHDWNYADRKELTGYCRQYIAELESNDAFWNNPEILDYLNQMLYKVYPEPMIPGRPGCFSVRLLRDTTPNAFAATDGTIVIHEGLLVLMESEEELLGVLAHEIAHVVLDHSLKNLKKDKAADAFASFLGGLAAGATAYAYSNQGYSTGYATVAGMETGLAFYLLSDAAFDLLGTAYSRAQEIEADALAKQWLENAGCDPASYGRVLLRLKEYGRVNGESYRISLADDHPSLGKRLKKLNFDEDSLFVTLSGSSNDYDRRISAILEHYGELCLSNLQVNQALWAFDRAQNCGWYTGNALVLKAAALRLSGGYERNPAELHSLLAEAEGRDEDLHYRIHIEKGLLALRDNDRQAALSSFQMLKTELEAQLPTSVAGYKWADSMVSKIQAN